MSVAGRTLSVCLPGRRRCGTRRCRPAMPGFAGRMWGLAWPRFSRISAVRSSRSRVTSAVLRCGLPPTSSTGRTGRTTRGRLTTPHWPTAPDIDEDGIVSDPAWAGRTADQRAVNTIRVPYGAVWSRSRTTSPSNVIASALRWSWHRSSEMPAARSRSRTVGGLSSLAAASPLVVMSGHDIPWHRQSRGGGGRGGRL